jgi:hypothetical protein
MNYFYFNKIKINLNLQPQIAPSGRGFVLSGCVSDLKNSNYKFNYYTYIFKYLDKVKFDSEHKETTEFFGFYFENEKVMHKLGHKEINKLF